MRRSAHHRRTGGGRKAPAASARRGTAVGLAVMLAATAALAQDAGAPITTPTADAAIAERLEVTLEATGWFDAPDVVVRNGVAFLAGEADTQEHRAWAATLAERTDGIVAVVNRMVVDAGIGTAFGRAGNEVALFLQRVLEAWPLLVLAIAIMAVTWLAARLVSSAARRLLGERIASPLLRAVLVRLFALPVFLLGLYFVLQLAGLTQLAITVLGGTGLFGIIIGFAFRDIAENFLASLLLSVRNPFRGGDLIEVAGHTGIVQNLNTRSTVLLTLEGNHVQIPNATVFKSTITNYSSVPSRRASFVVGIGYDSSVARAQLLISRVLRQHPAVLEAPEPLVLVEKLGDSTVDLRIDYWFDSATYAPNKINSALLRLTKNALIAEGIEMPDAAREVVFPRGVPVIGEDKAPPKPKRQEEEPEDLRSATVGEGNLSNESEEVADRSRGSVPEAGENLLKP